MKLSKQILQLSSWSGLAGILNVTALALLYIYLTRHLSQSDFGIYALASSVILVGVSLLENTFSLNLIRKEHVDEKDFEAVISINILTAAGISICILFVAFLIQYLYAIDTALVLIGVMLPVLFLVSFNAAHLAGLKRNLLFRKLAFIDIISLMISVTTIIVLVHLDFSYWSLAFGLTAKYASYTFLIIITKSTFCGSRISIKNPKIRAYLQFGKYVLFEKMFTSIISYLDVFLIAYFLNIQLVGVYDIMKKILLRPFLLVYQYLEDVTFPILSKSQNVHSQFQKTYGTFISFIGRLLIPALIIVLISIPWILSLLPHEYRIYSQLAALLLMFGLSVIVLNPFDMLLYSKGLSRQFFIWYGIISIIQIIVSVLALQHSLDMYLLMVSGLFFVAYIIAFFILINPRGILSFKSYFSILKYVLPVLVIFCFTQMGWIDQLWLIIPISIIFLVLILRFLTGILKSKE